MRRWFAAATCLTLGLSVGCGGGGGGNTSDDAAIPDGDAGMIDKDGSVSPTDAAMPKDASTSRMDAAMPSDDHEPPTVRITPHDGEHDVSARVVIELEFSEAMNASSVLDAHNFRVLVDDEPVDGERAYDADTEQATFVAADAYAAGTTVEVVVSGVRDRAGNALASPRSASFEIASAPKVSAHVPLSDAVDVSLQGSVVVTFDRVMDHDSLGAESLFIEDPSDDDAALPADYEIEDDDDATTVTITPDAALVESSTYRVVVTTAALSDRSVPLAKKVEFEFETEGVAPEVATITPGDGTEGVAIGPADLSNGGEIRIEFDEAMDIDTFADNVVVFDGVRMASRQNVVAGTVSADGTHTLVFVPDEPLLEAHTYWVAIDGEGATNGGVTDAYGNALADDALFSFTTESLPYVTSIQPETGTTFVGTSAHLLVFFSKPITTSSVGITPTAGTPLRAVSITDSLGNAVGGQVQTVPQMSEVIDIRRYAAGAPLPWDPRTRYTVDIDGAVPGREITDEHGHPVFDHRIVRFTTGDDPDIAKPALACATCTSPTDDEVIGRTATLSAQWNEALDASTVTSQTVKIYRRGDTSMLIPARVSYDASTRRILAEPLSPLPSGALLTFAFTTGIKDLSGNTKAAPDNAIDFSVAADAAPSVVATMPAQNATDVAPNTRVRFVFSEPIDPSTLEVTADSDGDDLPGAVRYDALSNTAVFIPTADLPEDAEVMVTVSPSLTDLDGMAIAGSFDLMFETGTDLDTDAPAIDSTSPLDNAAGIAPTTNIEVIFDEPIDPTTITSEAIALQDVDSGEYQEFDAIYDASSERLLIAPRWALSGGDMYQVVLAPTITDLAGNALDSTSAHNVFGFTVESSRPTASSSLASAVVGAAVQLPIVFGEDMDAYSIAPETVSMTNVAGDPILVAIDYDPSTRTLMLEPAESLPDDTYTVHLVADAADPGASIRDVAGNVLTPTAGAEWTLSFTVNTVAPNVASFLPTCNSVINVDAFGTTQFRVVFDRNVTGPAAASLTGNTSAFTLSGSTSGAETLTVSQGAQTQVTLSANNGLGNGETYTLTVVAAQIRSQTGATPMASNRVCSFTTQKILYAHDASAGAAPSCASQAGAANGGNSWGCRVVPGSGDVTEAWHGGNTTPAGNYVRDCPTLLQPDGAARVVSMTTPTLNLQGLTSVEVSFDVSDDVNSAAGDFGRLVVMVGGLAQSPPLMTWTGQNFGTTRHETYDVSNYTGQVIQLRYTLSIAGGKGGLAPSCAATRHGMLVDNIRVVGN